MVYGHGMALRLGLCILRWVCWISNAIDFVMFSQVFGIIMKPSKTLWQRDQFMRVLAYSVTTTNMGYTLCNWMLMFKNNNI